MGCRFTRGKRAVVAIHAACRVGAVLRREATPNGERRAFAQMANAAIEIGFNVLLGFAEGPAPVVAAVARSENLVMIDLD